MRPPVVSGQAHHKATLTDDEVRELRRSEGSTRELARRFGVSQSTVSRILRGESR